MSCYQCVHCGKCPVGNLKAAVTCSVCGAPLGPGITACPQCGQSLKGHMRAKPADIGFSIDDTQFIAKLGRKRNDGPTADSRPAIAANAQGGVA